MSEPPSLTIVIEWENAGRIGCVRGLRMLAQLHRQLVERPAELVASAEILLVYDAGQVDGDVLRSAVDAHGRWPAEIRYLRSAAAGYYEQKNHGAERATGDIIVFLDSDVVPEAGWLEALLRPFSSRDTLIVAGATSVERKGLYSTSMAIGWIFPLPPEVAGVSCATLFYANNVAFRREIMAQMRFPEARQYRVQVGVVQRRLIESGQEILMSSRAAVLHPPPQGLGGFAKRALWCGYDASTEIQRRGPSLAWRAPSLIAAQALGALRRVARERRRAGLGLIGTAGALGIVSAYQGIRMLGFAFGLVAPAATWRQLKRFAA